MGAVCCDETPEELAKSRKEKKFDKQDRTGEKGERLAEKF
jgi:hypothetical protein